MKNNDIRIPDDKGDWRMNYTDTLTFTFDVDVNRFSTSDGEAFNPPLPAGGFVRGNKIGPYKPKKHNTNITFSYDNSEPIHVIHIGN